MRPANGRLRLPSERRTMMKTLSMRERKLNGEAAPVPELGRDLDPASVAFDDILGNCQPEPRSSLPGLRREERLEDAGPWLRSDALTGVSYLDARPCTAVPN